MPHNESIFERPLGDKVIDNHFIVRGRGVMRKIDIDPQTGFVSDLRLIKIRREHEEIQVSGAFFFEGDQVELEMVSVVIESAGLRIIIQRSDEEFSVREARESSKEVIRAANMREIELYELGIRALGKPDESLTHFLRHPEKEV